MEATSPSVPTTAVTITIVVKLSFCWFNRSSCLRKSVILISLALIWPEHYAPHPPIMWGTLQVSEYQAWWPLADQNPKYSSDFHIKETFGRTDHDCRHDCRWPRQLLAFGILWIRQLKHAKASIPCLSKPMAARWTNMIHRAWPIWWRKLMA